MLFNSIEFALFLPIVFLLYWYVFNRHVRVRNLFIIAVSYIFYGWWDWRFLWLIAFTSLASYLSGIGIERARRGDENRSAARWICCINVVLNLGILCLFKYYNFFATEFAQRFLGGDTSEILIKLILPVGISFYTFQALSYTIDVYRRNLQPTHDPTAFFAYIAFFPQLVAGPIERATNLLPQFYRLHSFDYEGAVDGCRRILWGLFKKVAVADSCAMIVNQAFDNYENLPASSLLIGAFLFAFQIYGDFSGYSDIAIGVARLFGIKLMLNFRMPYFSRDIAEFWRRWHISLNTWFRDYIYIPLGGSRVAKPKVVRNTFVIFLISGFWHGANWTYIAWGGAHALMFIPGIFRKKGTRKYLDVVSEGRLFPRLRETASMAVTFCVVMMAWILFRAPTITDAIRYIGDMFSPTVFSAPEGLGPQHLMWHALLFVLVMMVAEWLQRTKEFALDLSGLKSRWLRWGIYYAVLAMILVAYCEGGVETFIYFQF